MFACVRESKCVRVYVFVFAEGRLAHCPCTRGMLLSLMFSKFGKTWQGELCVEEKSFLFIPTWKTGTCKLTRSSLSFFNKTKNQTVIYDLEGMIGVEMVMQGGIHVIVVKTAKRVFKFSHQDRGEAFRWLTAFSALHRCCRPGPGGGMLGL